MQTASGAQATSPSFKEFINLKTQHNLEFKKLVADFSKLNLYHNIIKTDFPKNRDQNNSTYDLIAMHAVNSVDFNEFKMKCLGLIPIETNQKMIALLKSAEQVYDKIIWNEYKPKIEKQLAELSKYENANMQIFNKIKAFYDSTWSEDIPFQIAIYPIPGVNGFSTATPHINSLCVGVLTDETDYNSRNGAVLHEICHMLYKEQPRDKQFEVDQYFKDNNTIYSKHAYSYMDESVATAIGNGWAYKKISGKIDENDWYANKTINDFAKVLYPKVEEYLEKGKTIDKEFVDNAIAVFSKKFPKSIYDYSILLNSCFVYADDMSEMEAVNSLSDFFQIYSLNFSASILHSNNFNLTDDSKDTRVFIIHKNQLQTLSSLKKIFPQIQDYEFKKQPMTLSFFDNDGRAVIILVLNNKTELGGELLKMRNKNFFDIKSPLQQ